MIWKRWISRAFGGLVGLAALSGCKQQLFLEPGDYQDAVKYNLPPKLETSPHEAVVPAAVDPVSGGPATVLDPSRPARYLALKECVAIALEQGNVGNFSPTQPGFKNDNIDVRPGAFSGGVSSSQTDFIRAFALDPAASGANIERSLSKFDARWVTSMTWQKNDNPVAAQFVSFQSQNDQANFNTTLAKPLPTGGVAGITFSTNYVKFSNVGNNQQFVNPNYTPSLQFTFEQPLLQLFGVEINQLTSTTPQSFLIGNLRPSGGQGVDGILLSRVQYDQSRSDFDQRVNYMLLNVEAAYWNLYAAYYNLYAQEDGLRSAFDGFRFQRTRVETGTDQPQTLDQARAQFELFRGQVYRARGQVLQAERQLRGLMGLRSDDGYRLVPVDEPTLAQLRPDFYDAANEAIAFRPELMIARQDLKARQFQLMLTKNLRRPDLRVLSSYNVQGIGTRLDGPEFQTNAAGTQIPGNAFTNFANNQFSSWQVGLRLDMPLGFRDANAQVRQSQLALTRSYYQLRDYELKALEQLVDMYRRVYETHALIGPARNRREALQTYVWRVRELIRIGRWDTSVFFNYLQVQRDLAQSIADEFTAVANYNTALAQLEFAKGTIQRYNNISVSDGPLPANVGKRAADHIRERTEAAIELRQRPPVDYTGPRVGVGPAVGSPFADTPTGTPALTDKREAVPEELPDPRPSDKKDGPMPLPMGGAAPGTTTSLPNPGRAMPGTLPAPTPVTNAGGSDADPVYFTPAGRVSIPPGRTVVTPAAPVMPAVPPVPVPSVDGRSVYPGVPPLPPAGSVLTAPPLPPVGAVR